MGVFLDHLPGPHLAKGLEYFLVFTFRETTHINVGISYMVTTLTSIILSTYDVFFFLASINISSVKSQARMHLHAVLHFLRDL